MRVMCNEHRGRLIYALNAMLVTVAYSYGPVMVYSEGGLGKKNHNQFAVPGSSVHVIASLMKSVSGRVGSTYVRLL